MSKSSFLLGAVLGEMHGNHPGAWRMPAADPHAYTDVTAFVRAAQTAERGGLDYLFFPDRVFIWGDLESRPPIVTMEPTLTLAAIAPATRRIGLVTTLSTSFVEPYTLARQLRALDVMSHGRAGWQAIPSYEPEAFANYGRPVPSRTEKYERFNEAIQITQALWGSWDRAAGTPDKATGRFADTSHIRPINMQGRHVGSRGPLQIPPSEQGQPVIFMPFASGLGVQAASRYANGIIAHPSSMEEAKAQRAMMRSMTVEAGRDADEVKFLSFFALTVGPTLQEAVERRMGEFEWSLQHVVGCSGREQFRQALGWGFPAERLAWSAVQLGGGLVQVLARVDGQVGALGEVLPQQAVGVLVRAALPGTGWVAEVDRDVSGNGECAMGCHL
jgi:alkanesulfonate monooxygenase SsuD/methylene tetrahydromethanopterin reductase-like flavin-dependent oxidoreductase (luciferase family)